MRKVCLVLGATLIGIAFSSHGEGTSNLEVQMSADLLSYESCIKVMAEKLLPTEVSAAEISATADRNCGVYHEYYMARAHQYVYQSLPVPGEPDHELIREHTRAMLLEQFRATSDDIRKHTKQRLTTLIDKARSAQ